VRREKDRVAGPMRLRHPRSCLLHIWSPCASSSSSTVDASWEVLADVLLCRGVHSRPVVSLHKTVHIADTTRSGHSGYPINSGRVIRVF
jgi:hypothetical protein